MFLLKFYLLIRIIGIWKKIHFFNMEQFFSQSPCEKGKLFSTSKATYIKFYFFNCFCSISTCFDLNAAKKKDIKTMLNVESAFAWTFFNSILKIHQHSAAFAGMQCCSSSYCFSHSLSKTVSLRYSTRSHEFSRVGKKKIIRNWKTRN